MLTVALAGTLLSDQQTYSNHLYLMLPVAALLTVAQSGAALSLDARREGGRDWVPGWPVWLLCAQVSIVYGFAALAKLNPDFLSGSVVASYLRRDGLLALPDAWRSLEPMLILSLLAICSEAFLAFALWVPRWRPAAMVVGLGLHVFIAGWLVPDRSPVGLLAADAAPVPALPGRGAGGARGGVGRRMRLLRHLGPLVPAAGLDARAAIRPALAAGIGRPAGERGRRGASAPDRAAQRRGARRLRRGHAEWPRSWGSATSGRRSCACSRSRPLARLSIAASPSAGGASCRSAARAASEPRSS